MNFSDSSSDEDVAHPFYSASDAPLDVQSFYAVMQRPQEENRSLLRSVFDCTICLFEKEKGQAVHVIHR